MMRNIKQAPFAYNPIKDTSLLKRPENNETAETKKPPETGGFLKDNYYLAACGSVSYSAQV